MCGIIGVVNNKSAFAIVKSGLGSIRERGRDGVGYFDGTQLVYKETVEDLPESNSSLILAQNLHAIVNKVDQPMEHEGKILIANCEIYNWKKLKDKHNIAAENDAELLLKLIAAVGVEDALGEVRGVYAFAYYQKGIVTVARDLMGIKPLWFSLDDGFAFASEKKALQEHFHTVSEVHPRSLLVYDIEKGSLDTVKRTFLSPGSEESDEKIVLQQLKETITEALRIRIPDQKFGLLFSGGLDSVIIAKLLKDLGCEFTCYTAATKDDSPDLVAAKEAAELIDVDLKWAVVPDSLVEQYLKKVTPLIEDSNVVKVGVAVPLFIASEIAHQDGNRVIFSGSGADEVFGGYNRYKNSALKDLNKDLYSDVLKIFEKNTYRDDVLTMNNNLELRVPFLDLEVVSYGLSIAPELKLFGEEKTEKYILRQLALDLGVSEGFALRKKKAAQYGSGFDAAIGRLAKKNGYPSKSSYLKTFYSSSNVKLGALLSGGKDSWYAAYVQQQQNYEITCGITLKSKNPHSFMFHTPNVDLVGLQCDAAGIPLITQETLGEEEKELEDLRAALQRAKDEHAIEGIVNGALYSNYQRQRIEQIADELGLKLFSPLWHIGQEQELRELLKNNFSIMFVHVGAEGLDDSWLGRNITSEDVDTLVELNKKIGLNIAGEGGEFESLVLDCPLFSQRIDIQESSIEKDESSATLRITQAQLCPRQ